MMAAPAQSSSRPAAADARWGRGPGTLWRITGNTLVLLPDRGGSATLVVTGSAAALWELLASPITLADLSEALASTYEVDPSVVAADLAPVLEQLQSAGALERSA